MNQRSAQRLASEVLVQSWMISIDPQQCLNCKGGRKRAMARSDVARLNFTLVRKRTVGECSAPTTPLQDQNTWLHLHLNLYLQHLSLWLRSRWTKFLHASRRFLPLVDLAVRLVPSTLTGTPRVLQYCLWQPCERHDLSCINAEETRSRRCFERMTASIDIANDHTQAT